MMLNEYVVQQNQTERTRFGKLLLLLPGLRAVNSSTIENVFFRQTVGTIHIERILCDLFKSS